MENKNVGLMIIGIAIVMIIIIFIFNSALKDIVGQTCTHGPSCTMYDTIKTQTGLSLAIAGIILIVGIFMLFNKPREKIVVKKIKEKKKKLNLEGLDKKEKNVIKIIQDENGTMFQAELMEKLGIGKVGLTRLLDKLEAKQLIERKRRGMNNIIVLRG
ncbi:MAG: MarR family transcriptional regulator [Nanoarchaeota archaeon]|nr:MarR family transcriptional regulator [Nanoarchaeota archaeon]